jgi:small-conductance mechanosensitive channel
MFGYVTEDKYIQERDARIRAEAVSDTLRTQIEDLKADLDEERKRVERLVSHIAPEPEKPVAFTGMPLHLSSQQLRKVPAVGKRGIRQRASEVSEAIAREKQEASENQVEAQREVLNDEELNIVDEAVGKR